MQNPRPPVDHVVVRQRLARNLLSEGCRLSEPAAVVSRLCGVQAQDLPAARLAVRARSTGLTDSAVEAARVQARSVVRTWAMRSTLHLVASEDLHWLRRLLAPAMIRGSARRSAQLGLDEAAYRRANEVMEAVLAAGEPVDRAGLRTALEKSGVDAAGQRMVYLLLRASAEGLICEGPEAKGKPTYVLTDRWLGRPPGGNGDREADLAVLASRYLSAYGPAAPADMAGWSGLAVTECRRAFGRLANPIIETTPGGRTLWSLEPELPSAAQAGGGDARLLPAFDTFLLGYRNRDLHLQPRFARRVNAGGGMVKPVLIVNGRVEAVWRLTRRAEILQVDVEPFGHLASWVGNSLQQEVEDVGRFLAREVRLNVLKPEPA